MAHWIDWGSAKVDGGELVVRLQPEPDFAFLKAFDMVVIEGGHAAAAGRWGDVQVAGGRIRVGSVQPDSAAALEEFLDGVVGEANKRAEPDREAMRREAARERAVAEEQRRADAAAAAAEEQRDDALEERFRHHR